MNGSGQPWAHPIPYLLSMPPWWQGRSAFDRSPPPCRTRTVTIGSIRVPVRATVPIRRWRRRGRVVLSEVGDAAKMDGDQVDQRALLMEVRLDTDKDPLHDGIIMDHHLFGLNS